MNTDKKSLIKSIYLYFFTAVGLVMFLIGTFQLVQFGVKKLLLPKYYLQEYQETRCDAYAYPQPVAAPDGKTAAITPENKTQMEADRQKCQQKLEEQRQVQQVIDLSSAITLIVLGAGTFIFHYTKTRSL